MAYGQYTEDKPKDCRYCYFWGGKKKRCMLNGCYYQRKEKEMQEKAKLFLMENEEERDYLPLCVIAANLCRLQRHTRKIYTNYCRCSFELQQSLYQSYSRRYATGRHYTPYHG